MKFKVLVTGVAGFVGSNLAEKLFCEGCDVTILIVWLISQLKQECVIEPKLVDGHEEFYSAKNSGIFSH